MRKLTNSYQLNWFNNHGRRAFGAGGIGNVAIQEVGNPTRQGDVIAAARNYHVNHVFIAHWLPKWSFREKAINKNQDVRKSG